MRKPCVVAVLFVAVLFVADLGASPALADAITSADYTLIGGTGDGSATDRATKWAPGAGTATAVYGHQGTSGGATWSIMGAGFDDGSGSDGYHTGSTLSITTLGVTSWKVSDYEGAIDWALDQWAAVSGFTNLGRVDDGGGNVGAAGDKGGTADIRVAAWDITKSGVLAHAWQPGNVSVFGTGGGLAGDIHLDSGWTWVDGGSTGIDIYTVLLHEMGHSLGLGHSAVGGAVMGTTYSDPLRTLSADDIAGIRYVYGPVPEPATSFLFAAGLIVLAVRRRRRG